MKDKLLKNNSIRLVIKLFVLIFLSVFFVPKTSVLAYFTDKWDPNQPYIDFGPGHEVYYDPATGEITGCPNPVAIPGNCVWTNEPGPCGGGGGGGDDCERGSSCSNSCSYWDNVNWYPVDLCNGTQMAIQTLRTNTCSYDCCDSACTPSCPPNDPIIRPAAVCGDGEMNGVIQPSGPQGLCPGITPQYPVDNPPVDDLAYTRTRAYVTNDPRDPEGLLRPVDEYQCDNPMGMEYLEMICEECDDGFCGSDTCYGPRDGAAYACRWRAPICGDDVFQPNGANGELCDPSVHPHCASTCQAWAECGDGEENWPPDFVEPEECDDENTIDGDGCDSNCQEENQGSIVED